MSANTYNTSFGEIELTVTPDKMYAAADLLEKTTANVRRELEQLQQTAQLTSSYWKGSCAEKERGRFKAEDENFYHLIENLKNYALELKIITGLYVAGEQGAVTTAKSLEANVLH